MEEKIEKALGLFLRLDQLGKSLTAMQLGLRAVPTDHADIRGAFLRCAATKGGEEFLDTVIEEMEDDIANNTTEES